MNKSVHSLRPPQQSIKQAAEAAEKAKPQPEPQQKKRVINLEYPVIWAGEDYGQLTVRRLKAKDFRVLDTIEGGGNAAAITMAALVCGVDEAIIDELDASDYFKLQEAIADFFPQALVAKFQAKPST